ncbi:MAG: hypothetical protein IKH52_01400 [Bacteroidaceae bacterium]|nr:hypothetical protein [Bacteroidaceae bacterium]
MKKFLATLCCLLVGFALPAMAQKVVTKKQWKNTARIVYSLTNRSVIDPYKATYTIEANKDSIVMNIYLGNEYVGKVSQSSSPEMFNNLKDQLAYQGLGAIPESKVDIIPLGGDRESIACYAERAEEPFYDAFTTGGVGTMTLKTGDPQTAFETLLPIAAIIQGYQEYKREKEEQQQQLRPTLRQSVSDEQWEATTRAVYDFTDSSTPPQHHRSYSIDIREDSIRVSITCYGKELLRTAYPFSKEQFQQVKQQLAAQGISKGQPADEPLPTGGKTHALALYSDGSEAPYFSASSYAGIGTLYIKKGRAADAFLQALPEDIKTIIDRTRQN